MGGHSSARRATSRKAHGSVASRARKQRDGTRWKRKEWTTGGHTSLRHRDQPPDRPRMVVWLYRAGICSSCGDIYRRGHQERESVQQHTALGDGRGKARVFVALTHLRHAIGERRLMTGAGAAGAGAGAEVAAGDGRLRSVPTVWMGFVSVKSMGSCSSRLEAGMDLGRGRVAVAAVVAAGSRRSPTRPREGPLVGKNGLEGAFGKQAGREGGRAGTGLAGAGGLALTGQGGGGGGPLLPGLCACLWSPDEH